MTFQTYKNKQTGEEVKASRMEHETGNYYVVNKKGWNGRIMSESEFNYEFEVKNDKAK